MNRRVLILGVGGQDGSYLADILTQDDCEVHGVVRRSSVDNIWRIRHLLDDDKLILHHGDLSDPQSIHRIIADVRPHELYNEADQDSVGWSKDVPAYSMDVTAGAVGRTLESIRQRDPTIRFFQPCSAMIFGDAAVSPQPAPQNEQTPFNPQSPYAVAKCVAFWLCRYYREQHNMHVSTAILYNHDSPRRTDHYLLHKVCKAAVRIAAGKQETLALGNLDARVDVGYAFEYMLAAVKILRLDKPDDFVIGTGTAHSVGELVEMAFAVAGVVGDWSKRITVDPQFYFPGERSVLRADCRKAEKAFGFRLEYDARQLIELLVREERKK